MRIGIVTTWFERGAAYVSKQYMSILEKSNQVYIYARGGEKYGIGEKDWDYDNVTWGKLKQEIVTDIDLLDFEQWIKKYDLEIIFFNEQIYWEPVIFAKKLGIRTGAYIDYYTLATIPLFGLYDFLLCNTKRHYSVFKEYNQCYYVPWGTNIDLFTPINGDIRKKCEEIIFFMSVGYDPIRKGVEVALKAFSRLEEKEACKLLIHTQVDIRAKLPECMDIIERLENVGKLEIIQKSVPAPGLYYKADVYVYPSCLDGIGLTLTEAIASGLPIITTDMAPMNEFGESNFVKLIKVDRQISREDAYYWPLSVVNEDSLYDAMIYYIQNKERIPEMKIRAREYALKRLDWMKNEKKLNTIFSSVEFRPLDGKLTHYAKKIDKQNRFIDYRLKDYIAKVDKINSKLDNIAGGTAIYCAGVHTKKLLEQTNILRKNIIAIIDKIEKGKRLVDFNVVGPECIKKLKPETIVISSYKYQKEIEWELLNSYKYSGRIIKLYDEEDDCEFYDI